MSDTQTVVDVIISGSTATVVDTRIDGVTTVAGAAPVTNVSGQVPDLGVNTDILATEGDILSLTNDVANLRANLIVTGNTLTDEIGALSGELISTGNNLEFKISNLSGDLIASGNNLDSLRDILSGNLITTGQTLTADLNTLSGNLNSRILSTGEVVDDISGNLITTGQTLTNLIGGNDTDISQLKTATGELQDKKFDKTGGTISGSILPNQSGTLSLGSEALPFLSGHFKDLTVSNNTLFIGEVPIHSSNGGIDFRSATGVTEFQDVSIRNLTVTGTEVIIDVEHLGVKDNTIVINSGEQGAGITAGSGGIVIDRGTLPDADIIFNETNDRFEIDFPLSVENSLVVKRNETGHFAESSNLVQTGQTLTSSIASSDSSINTISGNLVTTGQTLQTQITSNDNDISTLTSNIVTTGQTLQTQITSNDSDISTLSSNLVTTGQTLTSEIASVSGLISGSDNANSRIDTLSGNVIETGQYLEDEILVLSGIDNQTIANLIATGQTLTAADNTLANNLYITGNRNEQIIKQTGDTLSEEVATVSGLITSNDGDIAQLKTATGVLKTTTETNASNLVSTGQYLTSQISIVSGIAGGTDLTTLSGRVDTLSGNLITTGQTLQTQITSNDSDISTLTSNLITTGQTLTSEIAIVSGLTTGSSSDPELSGKVDTLSGNLITTGQTLQTQITSNDGDISTLNTNLGTTGQTLQAQITSNDSDISTLTSNLITTGQTLTSEIAIVSGIAENASDEALSGKVDTLSGNLITTGQTLQTQITSNDSDITSLTSNLVTTGQTLTTDITTVSGLIVDNDGDITALKTATGVLKTSTDSNTANLITTGQTLQTQITSNDGDISTLTTNLGTTGQTLQTQITSNDSDISTLTSNLITTGQTLTTDITTVSGLITNNDADITALKSATGVLKTSTDTNTTNLITTGQTLQTQITSNDSDISTLTTNVGTTGQTLQTQITSNDSDITNLTSNLVTTGQTLQAQITSNDGDITTLTSNLVTTGQTLTTNIDTVATNLGTSGQTLQTQITSNDSDISTLTSNLGTTGQTLQTQITSNDSDIASLTTNLGTTGQTLQTQITSNDSDISTLDSTTVKLTTNQSIAGNKIFTNDVTINNLTVTGTEVVVDVENLAVKDNIIQINSGESGAGISRISGGIVIDRGTATNANILYNDANDRFELNFPLAVEGEVVASASNLITTGQTLTTNINTVSTNLGTSGQTLQTQITSNDSDISTLTTNLGTTGQTLQTQITSNDSDISTLTTNLGTTGQTLQTQITSNDSDISTLTSNLVTTGQTLQTQITSNDSDISTLTTNLGTTGQTLQTQITSNDSDISTLTSNLVTTGQTLTTNINTVSTNLGTSGQTLQTQITSNDTDITNLSSNLVTTGQTLTTNINTVATNLVTTGQTLTSEIATVSGLIPATVIDGGGTANTVPLWSDANTIGDSVISQSSSRIGIGTNAPDQTLHVNSAGLNFVAKFESTDDKASILIEDNDTLNYIHSQNGYLSLGGQNSLSTNNLNINSTNGNVGIGTVTPTVRFHVNSSTSDTVALFQSSDSTARIQISDNDTDNYIVSNNSTLSLGANNATDAGNLNIASDGHVGIGTITPEATLHVSGAASDILAKFVDGSDGVDIATRGANRQQIDFLGSNTSAINAKGSLRINYDSDNTGTNDSIVFGRNGADESGTADLVINEGSVGIGTITPAEPLHVESTAADILINSTTANQATRIRLKTTSHEYRIGTQGTVDNFWIYDASNSAYRMVISPAGAVGINTTSPNASSKLHVYGWTIIQSATNFASLRLQSTTGSWDIDNNNGTFGLQWAGGDKFNITSAGSVGIGTNAPSRKFMIFGGSARMGIKNTTEGVVLGLLSDDAGYLHLNNGSGANTIQLRGDTVSYFNAGSVGIGTNSPARKLHVVGDYIRNESSAGSGVYSQMDGDGFTIYRSSANCYLNFPASGSSLVVRGPSYAEFIRVNSSGNVGIGTNAPDEKLHIEGAGNTNLLIESTSNHAQLVLKSENNTYSPYVVFKDAGADRYLIQANPSDSLLFRPQGTSTTSKWVVFNSNGSVGIGTETPGAKLHVNGYARIGNPHANEDQASTLILSNSIGGSATHDFLTLADTSNNGSETGRIVFKARYGTGSFSAGQEATFISSIRNSTSGAYHLAFGTTNDSSADAVERVRISSLGNVGIGTNAPATTLEASGTIRSTAFLPKIQLKRTGNAVANGDIEWLGNDDSVDWSIRANYDSGGDNFNIKEGSTSRLYIKSGKVGIGTVAPASLLHVGGAAASPHAAADDFVIAPAATDVGMTIRCNSNSGTGSIFFADTAANAQGLIRYNHNADYMSFYSSGDFFFDTGSVGIGTAAPVTKLDIWGAQGARPTDPFGGQNQLFISQGGTHNAGITISADNNTGTQICTFIQSNTSVSAALIGTQSNHGTRIRTNNTDRITIASGGAITFNSAFTFPTADGSAGQVLQTNGSGTVTWATVSGGGGISGSGTDNYIPRWNGTTALENSILYDTGSTLSVGTTSPNAVGGTSVLYLSGQSNMIVMSSSNVANNSSYIRHWGTAHFQWQTYTGSNTGYIELQPYGGQVAIGMRGTTTTYNLHIGAFGADDVNTFRIDGTNGSSETAAFVIENDGANGKVNFKHNIGNGTPATKLTLDHNGNLGIGTTGPSARLHLSASDPVLKITDTSTTDNSATLWLQENNSYGAKLNYNSHSDNFFTLDIVDSGTTTERFVINRYGNVGIGTNAPAGRLHVSDVADFYADVDGTDSAVVFKEGGGNSWRIGNRASGDKFNITQSATSLGTNVRFTIDDGGSVGIGTESPTELLEVDGNIRLGDGNHRNIIGPTNATLGIYSNPNDSNEGIKFSTDGGSTIEMFLQDGGNVGIGTEVPKEKLHISNGSSAGDGAVYPLRLSAGALASTSGDATGIKFIQRDQHNDYGGYVRLANTASTPSYLNPRLEFGVQNTNTNVFGSVSTKMVITGGGSVGIGTNAPVNLLHISGADESTLMLQANTGSTGDKCHIGFGCSTVMLSGTNMGAKITFERLGASTGGDLSFHTRPVGGTLTQRFVLRSDGNVGVGTNAPATKLQVAGNLNLETSGGDVGLWLHRTDAREYRLYVDSNGLLNLRDQDAGATRMAFKTDGNLGIATTTPGVKLHVAGQGLFANNGANIILANSWSSGNTDILFGGSGVSTGSANNTAARIRCLATAPGGAATGSLTFTVNSGDTFVDALYIKEDGNIGIGTPTPTVGNLQLRNSTVSILALTRTNGNAGASLGIIRFGNTDIDSNLANIVGYQDGTSDSAAIAFQTQATGASTATRMTIRSGGNIGIGTADPDGRLHVYTGSAGSTTPNTNHDDLTIESSGNAGLQLFTPDANYQYIAFGSPAGANRGYVRYGHNEEEMVLRAATVDILKIKSTGVGIGTTPNSSAKLESYITSGGEKGLRLNSNFSGGNAVDFIPAVVGVSNAGFSIDLAGTTRLVINDGGNVGIGTNSALDKLDVYGSGAVFRNLSDNADSVQIVRGTNHNANPDAKFYIFDDSSADWAAKINLGGASYGLDILDGADYFLLCRKPSDQRVFEVHGTSTVVNNSGIDYDFRVESNNDDYLLFTEGSTDRVAISTTAPAAKLHVEGDFKVGTTNNGNWMGYKDVSLNGNTYTTALTINLNNHTGCYVKLFLSGDWSSHSAVAFVGEYFIQNGSDGYAEPGTVISEFDNTNTDSIESKIVDPSSDTFTIQLKLSTAANGTLGGKLSYHVMGMATAVS